MGKTTREMIAAALQPDTEPSRHLPITTAPGGVPITISDISEADEIGVLELGMSEPGEMEVIADIARRGHGRNHQYQGLRISKILLRREYPEGETRIQDGMKRGGTLFLNGDNDLLRDVRAKDGCRDFFYGLGANCSYRAVNITYNGGRPKRIPDMWHGAAVVPVVLK